MTEIEKPQTQIAIRTLLAAGFTIEGSHRQPRHIEISCHRVDVLGTHIPYLIALSDVETLDSIEIEEFRRAAGTVGRLSLVVSEFSSEDAIAWADFLEALGGAVPNWVALGPSFGEELITASRNKLPSGYSGEAWLVFEDLIAAGLEYSFGRRVRRLGGRKRGKPVSDMQAQIPEEAVLVVDAKASKDDFDATWPNLRALVEYVKRQIARQRGQLIVYGAIVVAQGFSQDDKRLDELSKQFLSETGVPVSFLDATLLMQIVLKLKERPDLRNAIRWKSILTGGRIHFEPFERECESAASERIKRGE